MKMNSFNAKRLSRAGLAALYLAALASLPVPLAVAGHLIDGVSGPSFTFTAGEGFISTADGNSVYFWGYANGDGGIQYPGPTLIVNQGDRVSITLNNELPVPVSLLFSGQGIVTAIGGELGPLTREVPANNGIIPPAVTYSFVASEPGTYLYYSGSQPDLQTEMGLVGALIVRPTGFNPADSLNRKAYSHTNSLYDHEFLFLLTEMDESIHAEVEWQRLWGVPIAVDTTHWWPVYWFINGRTGPDTMLGAGAEAPWLPTQPYDCFPLFHPGEKVLMRVIGAGRDPHPFHHHGNHSRIIARDGRLLSSGAGAGANLSQMVFTIPATPGGTTDAIFSWTGEQLGWDAYGHQPGDPLATNSAGVVIEYAPDHGKPFPTTLPAEQNTTFGQMYGGSPLLGNPGILPPGEGGFNPSNGFMYLWHSHAEKEIVNFNLFPGGMLTMALIEAWPQP